MKMFEQKKKTIGKNEMQNVFFEMKFMNNYVLLNLNSFCSFCSKRFYWIKSVKNSCYQKTISM
jgi:hypothetical protein